MKRISAFALALLLLNGLLLLNRFNSQVAAQSTKSGTAKAVRVAAKPLKITLPRKEGSVRFLAIGDTGTGSDKQQELADVMVRSHSEFPFDAVLMMGDNMYGGEGPKDFLTKFENIYRPLIDQKVKFYASLGNHDEPAQRFYQHFNMDGKEYYRFTRGNVAFYALNSNYMDKKQVDWLNSELGKDTSQWKIAFMHHPPYSSGSKHGSDKKLREVVEPIFLKHGVNVVLTGHDHFYERVKPQKGIYYFVSGAGGKLRPGDVKDNSPLTDKAFDKDMSFMLIEIADDQMYFQVLSRTGETIDEGVISNPRKK